MRRRVLTRLVWLLLFYCVVFVLLVVMQFTRSGNFSRKIGDMLVSGHYSLSAENELETTPGGGKRLLEGKAIVFFGGLEFQLDFTPDRDNGLSLIAPEGAQNRAFSGFIEFSDNEALFTLSGGSEISFSCLHLGKDQGGSHELRISGKFADGVSAIEIPFRLLRSSVNRGGGKGILNISYNEKFQRGLVFPVGHKLRNLGKYGLCVSCRFTGGKNARAKHKHKQNEKFKRLLADFYSHNVHVMIP
jgi:hypothetical protein